MNMMILGSGSRIWVTDCGDREILVHVTPQAVVMKLVRHLNGVDMIVLVYRIAFEIFPVSLECS